MTDVGGEQPVVSLTDVLNPIALTCPGEECRDLQRQGRSSEIVEVNSFDVVASARCQASAATPSPPFEATMFTATKTVALRAVPGLRRHDTALASVGAIMREAQRADDGAADDDWLRSFLKSSSIDVRARVAGRAAGWLVQVLDLLGVNDISDTRRWRTKVPLRWDYPGRGLRLRASLDLVVPDPEQPGAFLPVIVGSSGAEWLDVELGYLHVLWKSTQHPVAIDGKDDPDQTPSAMPQRRPSKTKTVIQCDEVIVLNIQEATITRRNLVDQWELGSTAALKAAEAVTQREDMPADITEVDVNQQVLASWFPSNLDQQPHIWRCQRCLWVTVCPSRSVAVSDLHDQPGDKPTAQSTASTPAPTARSLSRPTEQNTGALGSDHHNHRAIVSGGIRLYDPQST